MSDDEKFFERLRLDARPLRHQPDEVTLARIRARIHAHIAAEVERPSIAQLLTSWFRPLATAAVALALAATIGVYTLDRREMPTLGSSSVEVRTGGETYVVAE